jgi:protein-disulfide isomerase
MAEGGANQSQLPITAEDHVQGTAGARVTLIEYGDFECPYSGEAVNTIQVLQREFAADLRFVFRHFPLPEKHPHAIQAAEAAEAGRGTKKFLADVRHAVRPPMGT